MFEDVIKKIQESKLEKSSVDESFPSIFYVGLPKTGSKCIMHGFLNNQVAHWHNLETFERVYGTNDLSENNLDLYDLIKYSGEKFNFKPFIIEGVRDPIRRYISLFFEIVTSILNKGTENNVFLDKDIITKHQRIAEVIKNHPEFPNINIEDENIMNLILDFIQEDLSTPSNLVINELPYSSKLWEKHFNISINKDIFNEDGYFFKETEWCNLLLYKYEYIEDLENLFHKLNYNFENKKYNQTNLKSVLGKFYPIILSKLKFENSSLNQLYVPLSNIYNNNEIKSFIKNFTV